jgi:hypothetical protein
VLNVKTLLEAGYLSCRTKNGASPKGARQDDATAADMPGERDLARLSKTLPAAWRKWWRATA